MGVEYCSDSADGVEYRSVARNLKENAMKNLELLDGIGTAQSIQTIEKNVITANKELVRKLAEESQIESSMAEDDIHGYITSVLTEIKRTRSK